MGADGVTEFHFEAEVIYWRGPSPFFFVAVPPDDAVELGHLARAVSYGWGMIPVEAAVGGVDFATALWPKDGTYLLPLKAAVRRKAGFTAGDRIAVKMTVRAARA